MKKRIFSMLIAVCMVFTMLPFTAFATGITPIGASDVDSGTPTVCPHTEYDKACGFAEAVAGTPCAHLGEDGSYSCAPAASADEGTPSDAEYVCPHDDDCGFIAAIEGSPCKHEAEGLLYLGELAPEGTELTAEQQAFLDAHLAICVVCSAIMNPPMMSLESHTHCVCGGSISVGGHTNHTAVDYTAFTGNGGALATGNYYLADDVTLTSGGPLKSTRPSTSA